ncbi:hypothetical protein D3C77_578420 [compost metagenome]
MQHDTAAGGRHQFVQVSACLGVIAGLIETTGFGRGDQRVVRLGDVAGTGQGLLEHRRQNALLGGVWIDTIVYVGRRARQSRQRRQAGAQQHCDTERLQKRVFHDDSLS